MSFCRQAAPIVYSIRDNYMFIRYILVSLKGDDLRTCLIGVVISSCKQVRSPGSDIEAVQTGLSGPSGWQKALQREPNTQVKWQGSNYGCWKWTRSSRWDQTCQKQPLWFMPIVRKVSIRAETIIYDDFLACKGEQKREGKKYVAEDDDATHFSVDIWTARFQVRSTINDLVSPNTFSSRIVHPGKRAANSLLDNKVRLCSVSSIFFWSGLVINPHTLKYRTNLRFTENGNQWINNVSMCGSIGNHLFGVWQ